MTLKELNEYVHCESTRPEIEYEDYEIIIAGHPGEAGVTFHENAIVINDEIQKIIIWVW